jgi:hypothetical protein
MQFITEPNQLTIKLEGFEKLWALKRRLQIPHYAILEVDYLSSPPALQDFKGFLRFPGTSWPWRFLAGSYNRGKEHEFWYIQMKQPGLLVITLKPGTLNYDKVRLTCSPEVAQEVADWWQQHK